MDGKYPSILNVFKLNPDNKHRTYLLGEWGHPAFALLANAAWIGTEKIDGTNVRVYYNGANKVVFAGRDDKSQLPPFLVDQLTNLFTLDILQTVFGSTPVTLYGEGYGKRIQHGHLYMPDGVSFILFDVRIGGYWLERNNVVAIAKSLGINCVPAVRIGTLQDMVITVQNGLESQWGAFPAEGIVAQPAVQLFDRMGNRIITKIKIKYLEV